MQRHFAIAFLFCVALVIAAPAYPLGSQCLDCIRDPDNPEYAACQADSWENWSGCQGGRICWRDAAGEPPHCEPYCAGSRCYQI